MPILRRSSSTVCATARTCVSDVPLAMTKKSAMSVTPFRSRITTSFAFRSSAACAARCAASAEESCEVFAIQSSIEDGERADPEPTMGATAMFPRWKSARRAPSHERGGGRGMRGRPQALAPRPPPLSRTTTSCELLLDDPDLDRGLHVGVQLDRHAVDAERLDRLVQVDLPLLDVVALRLE